MEKVIKYRKDGSIKSIVSYVDGEIYKRHTFFKSGKCKQERDFRANMIINFNDDKYNNHYVTRYI